MPLKVFEIVSCIVIAGGIGLVIAPARALTMLRVLCAIDVVAMPALCIITAYIVCGRVRGWL